MKTKQQKYTHIFKFIIKSFFEVILFFLKRILTETSPSDQIEFCVK